MAILDNARRWVKQAYELQQETEKTKEKLNVVLGKLKDFMLIESGKQKNSAVLVETKGFSASLSQQATTTAISDMEAVFKKLGKKRFLELCAMPTATLKKELGKEAAEKFLKTETLPADKNRKLKIIEVLTE